MMSMNMTQKFALVTGAGSGIGRAAARALMTAGYRVALVGRRVEALEETAATSAPEQALVLATDVTDDVAVAAAFARVQAEFGRLDLLFNNAGTGINAPFAESDPADWTTMIDANLYGVLHCTQAAVPLMAGRPGAMICSVSSVGGRYGTASWSVYSATKFAVVGFSDALRKELGPDGVRVCVLEPGAVRTEFGANVREVMDERWDSLDAMGPQDVAQALVYAFAQPPNVLVQEIQLRPVLQVAP